MKTITMYELLGLVKDGKAPKKIRFDNIYWKRKYGEKNVYYTNDTDSDLFIYFFRKNLTFTLNDTVEILEEPIISKLYINNELQYDLEEKKIPEKSKIDFNTKLPVSGCSENEAFMMTCISHLGNTMDKIIDYLDYLKNKGDE